MRTNFLGSLFALLTVACLSVVFDVPAGLGQTSSATLTGIVQDSTGAVLPDVIVSATDVDRNKKSVTSTNHVGSYVLPALSSGNYAVTAELPGFKTFLREGIVMQVNKTVRIDIGLDVGPIDEKIEVTAAVPLLDDQVSSRGSVIDRRDIMELPLNGRSTSAYSVCPRIRVTSMPNVVRRSSTLLIEWL